MKGFGIIETRDQNEYQPGLVIPPYDVRFAGVHT
ncbi:hypothetical protein F383_32671 [Gossypium arboreum]|uniref:Uncharacterized protein n=1 Tax=Gossypium arboreum TaxID=29729 RepID=A0A0B0PL11_GOSAR|nr:hypothetical protein F383_32671 [Gossypium arboreum]